LEEKKESIPEKVTEEDKTQKAEVSKKEEPEEIKTEAKKPPVPPAPQG
jgi:hypothetical protein